MHKYPRTPHLADSRRQPGDEDLGHAPFAAIRGRELVDTEKLDGANAGISFTSAGERRLQSRGNYLAGDARERQLEPSPARPPLWPVLRDRCVLYGEWLYAKHTGEVVVARLAVGGATFRIQQEEADEPRVGWPARMVMTVDDPDAVFAQALAAGAMEVFAISQEHGWRTGRLADPFGHHWDIGRPHVAA